MIELAQQIIEDLNKTKVKINKNIWEGSHFEGLKNMEIDTSGKVGEILLSTFLESDNNVVFNGDSNTNAEDGKYDMKVNNKRVEVKTARIGSGNTFQHEHLKNTDECDVYVFIDFEPNCFYISIMNKDINFDDYVTERSGGKGYLHPIFEKSITHRKGEDNYKFDLSLSSLKKGLEKGMTIKIDTNDDNDDKIKIFLKKHL